VSDHSKTFRVGILGSTRGTALGGILDAQAAGRLPDVRIAIVISDKADAGILEKARLAGVAAIAISPVTQGDPLSPDDKPVRRSREEFDSLVSSALQNAGVDLILMIGYMRIVSDSFVDRWRGQLLNVHPSLLPAFPGLMNRAVHKAVLAAGVAETGCTIHQVSEEVDGGEIVLQKRCPVLPGDTVDTLKDRVQALEAEAFVEVLQSWSRS
jgi:phosphoribosylglycinamide formyltransferase 1